MSELKMPSFGADMAAGTLVEWKVSPGDRVRRRDIVAVIETQKGAIDMEAYEDGTVAELLVAEGDRVPVGTPIARIGDGVTERRPQPAVACKTEADTETKTKTKVKTDIEAPTATHLVAVAPADGSGRVRASPLARRLAGERGVVLSAVTGSGPAGAVLAADLATDLAEAGRAAPAPPDKPRPAGIDLAEMRSAIAAAMARSKREIPHYYLETTIDLQAASDWLAVYNRDRPAQEQVLMGALLHRAVALALTKSPELNGHYRDGAYHPGASVHLGSAIAIRGGGLIAPALLDAQQQTLEQTMAALMDLSIRVREGGLRSSELTEGTITVTSMGERGVEKVTGVIYPPQVAIVGLGKPVLRPWLCDGELCPRVVISVTLAADHRVSDGRQGAKFLQNLDRLLQTPERL